MKSAMARSPSAPGRLSTTTAWFQRLARRSAMIRSTASEPPPAPTGVTIRTNRSGHASDGTLVRQRSKAVIMVLRTPHGCRWRRIMLSSLVRGVLHVAPRTPPAVPGPRIFPIGVDDALQKIDQRPAFGGRERRQNAVVARLHVRKQRAEQPPAAGREIEDPRPPVLGINVPGDEPAPLQFLDHMMRTDRVDAHDRR